MEPLSLLVALAGAGVAIAMARHGQRGRADRWKRLAEDCGLTEVETGTAFPLSAYLEGRRGGHAVRLERYKRGKSQRGTRVVVRGLADGLSLKGEGLGSSIEKTLGTREVEIGDERFDADLFVRGESRVLRPLLDAETRRLARDVFGGRIRMEPLGARDVDVSVWVANGALQAEFQDRFSEADEPQADTLQLLLSLAERLAPVDRPDSRLAAIARSDPQARVRLNALVTLEHDYSGSAAAPETLKAALQDPDPEVRLHAGLRTFEDGRPVLEELALSAGASDSCSARALEGLGDRLTLEVARRALAAARPAGKLQTAQAVLPMLARRGGAAGRDALLEALADPQEALAASAARALASMDAPVPEDPLLQALERDSDAVRLAVAEALGRLGSARAVMPLKEVQVHGGRGVDKAAREAVARIQSRLEGATPGQLTLADGASSGTLSLTDDEHGRVSIPPADAARERDDG